jgi:DNA-binding MarR family transcriptional regulator
VRREETIDYNIKSTWHAISRMYNQQAAKYGLTTSMGFVLINIDSDHGTPATKIAPQLGLESRSLTRMLKTMEEKKLIYREKDPNDGRSVRIFLTPDGVIGKDIAKETVKTFDKAIKNLIPQKKLQSFFEVIGKINDLIETNNIYNQKERFTSNETYR